MPRMKEQPRPQNDEADDGFDDNQSIEDFRAELARHLRVIIAENREDWRHCPQRACRRQRGCTLPGGECAVPLPPRVMTDAQRDRFVGRLQRAMKKAFARAEAEGRLKPPPAGAGARR